MYKIKLSDGTEYEVNWCGVDNNILVISFEGDDTLTNYAAVFGDTNKTRVIEYLYDSSSRLFDNYTYLIGLADRRWHGGDVEISLMKSVRDGGM